MMLRIKPQTHMTKNETPWLLYKKDTYIHKPLFEYGFIVAIPRKSYINLAQKEKWLDNHSIKINGRQFTIFDESNSWQEPKNKSRKNKAAKVLELLSILADYTKQNNASHFFEIKQDKYLSNDERRDEIYLPLLLAENQHLDATETPLNWGGIYLYPWLTSNSSKALKNFSGFSQYVTAGCLFGSSLYGYDDDGEMHRLIKHDLTITEHTKITSIECDTDQLHPYEAMTFYELNKLMLLVKSLANNEKPASVLYHLPACDYILFGVALYLKNSMTHEALIQFITHVFIRAEIHIKKITEIGAQHGVLITISSPFSDLFDEIINYRAIDSINSLDDFSIEPLTPSSEDESMALRINKMLSKLGLALDDKKPNTITEKELVSRCLDILCNNQAEKELRTENQTVWSEYFEASPLEREKCTTIESLFGIGNPLVIVRASKGQGDYETCSFIPLSEKQIQISHSQYIKKRCQTLPHIINLTFLDPVVSCSTQSKGNVFYYSPNEERLVNVIEKNDHHLMRSASQNIGFFARGKAALPLEHILDDLKATESPRKPLGNSRLTLCP